MKMRDFDNSADQVRRLRAELATLRTEKAELIGALRVTNVSLEQSLSELLRVCDIDEDDDITARQLIDDNRALLTRLRKETP